MGPDRPVISIADRASEEALRWTTRLMAQDPSPARALLILSLDEGEGAENAARQTALALAQMQQRTLLIDANADLPWLQQSFGLPIGGGLAEVLGADARLPEAVQPSSVSANLSLVPAGRLSRGKLLASVQGFADVLAQARFLYAFTLITAAPYLKAPEAALLARAADAVLLVVGARRHTRSQIIDFKHELESMKAACAGILLCDLTGAVAS